MWRVPLTVSNTMMLKGLCCKKVFIPNLSALFCANLLISRVKLIWLELRCPLLSCMLVVLGREAWKALTCGIRYWTMHSENLLVAGNRRELASCSPMTTVKPKRGAGVHLVTLWKTRVGCFIICAGLKICTRWQVQWIIWPVFWKTWTTLLNVWAWDGKIKVLPLLLGHSRSTNLEMLLRSSATVAYVGFGEWWKAWRHWERGWTIVVVQSMWHRISKANSMFYAKKALFCDRKLPVKRHVDVFYSTCVPAALHGDGEWAYIQSMFQVLRIWELGELRRVLCLRRRPINYVCRLWLWDVCVYLLGRWWAARVMRKVADTGNNKTIGTARSGNASHRLTELLGASFHAFLWRLLDTETEGLQHVDWVVLTDKRVWALLVRHAELETTLVFVCLWCPCWKFKKRPLDDSDPWNVAWPSDTHRRLEVLGDNKIVINWMKGAWEVKGEEFAVLVRGVVDQLVRWYLGGTSRPRIDESDWCRHIFRDSNKASEKHANWLMDNGDSGLGAQWEARDLHDKMQRSRHILLSFDGARRRSGLGAGCLDTVVTGWIRIFWESLLWWTCAEECLSERLCEWAFNIWQFYFRQKLARLIFKLSAQIGQYST